jgi:hypothetical protein
MRISGPFAVLALLLTTQGCLPYACNRIESRALTTADSLSRAFSETVAVDTLHLLGSLQSPLQYPRTAAFAPDGTLYVTDTGAHRMVVVRTDGTERMIDLDTLRYPYLAGFVEDAPLVYSPDSHWIVAVTDLDESWGVRTPPDGPEKGALRYALVNDSGIWLKVLGPDFPGFIAHLDSTGLVDRRIPLTGPHWRYAGLLRSWLGLPVSLAGYRPVVNRVTPTGIDSLDLFGFDSPMLARSRQFRLGDVDEPPLLTAAAAAADSLLFVLNMRPGWLRVDAYGTDGRLRHVFVEPDPEFNQDFFPTDLAVRMLDSGGFELAVSITAPEPGVRRYSWAGQ